VGHPSQLFRCMNGPTSAHAMPRSIAMRIPISALNKHSFGPAAVATHAGFVRDSRRCAREGLQSTHMAGERRTEFGLF
jgi:hypothetical protein